MAAQRSEGQPVSERNVLQSPKSVELLVRSLQQVMQKARHDPQGTRAMVAERTGFDPEYLFNIDLLLLLQKLDPAVERNPRADLVELLKILSIDLKQLKVTEKLMNLDQIEVRQLLPESTNAVVPLTRGTNVGFNRLNVFGIVSPSLPTLDDQFDYLAVHGVEPHDAHTIDNFNYFSYEGDGVSTHPGGLIYLHLMTSEPFPDLTGALDPALPIE